MFSQICYVIIQILWISSLYGHVRVSFARFKSAQRDLKDGLQSRFVETRERSSSVCWRELSGCQIPIIEFNLGLIQLLKSAGKFVLLFYSVLRVRCPVEAVEFVVELTDEPD